LRLDARIKFGHDMLGSLIYACRLNNRNIDVPKMPDEVLKTPEMARNFAEFILRETRGSKGSTHYPELNVIDLNETWVVLGPARFTEDPFLENETFYVRVMKKDAEILNVGVNANFKLSPEMKEAFARARDAQGPRPPETLASFFDNGRPDLQMTIFLNGGVINSVEAACRLGAMILASERPDSNRQFLPLSAQEIDGQWHVIGERAGAPHSDSDRFEMVFRRANGQVTSLHLPS
jgi:hypothetical protein